MERLYAFYLEVNTIKCYQMQKASDDWQASTVITQLPQALMVMPENGYFTSPCFSADPRKNWCGTEDHSIDPASIWK